MKIKFDGERRLYRPENMKEYGKIVWVVTCKDELVQLNRKPDIPYTVYASYYSYIDIAPPTYKKGETYKAYLAKLVDLKDDNGKYTIHNVYPISDTITFTCEIE